MKIENEILKRCTRCLLPENYPGITFNQVGVCNHCTGYKERNYLGGDVLKKDIESLLNKKKDRNKEYDCIVSLSGGRDSSYLLYYLVKKLNLKVLAYSVDNGFIPEQTIMNMENMCQILNTKLVIEKHDFLEKCVSHHISSWLHRPTPAMIGVLCTGCRLGLTMYLLNFAKKNKIHIIFSGGTPFEGSQYKRNIVKINPNGRIWSFVAGYLFQLVKNPRWVLNRDSFIIQIKEFYYYFYPGKRKLAKRMGISIISPFAFHIKWDEKEVLSTIKGELGWRQNPDLKSTWRGDCEIAILKDYLYKKALRFNDKDDSLSCLVRDGQINRNEALERLEIEGKIPNDVLETLFEKIGVDYSTFINNPTN
jgi:hypothetical protein